VIDTGFGLAVQQLAHRQSQVLVLGHLAGFRNGDGWFTPADVDGLFQGLRVPGPANTAQLLRNILPNGLVVRRTGGGAWSLTPVGRQRAVDLLGDLDLAQIQPELVDIPGAEFGHALHTVIPPTLAPIRWAAPIKALLQRFPFETNVFCMTRFPDEDGELPDPVPDVITTARNVLDLHGLTLHLASDRVLDDDLLGNVAAHMWACQFGVALFENRQSEGLNYNLVTEVGSMLMTGRRCALLKDDSAPNMPTDLVGQIYKSVNFANQAAVAATLHLWAAEDLAFGRCKACPRDQ
jgi:hypothetical protein